MIELLVALGLGIVVSGMAFSVYRLNSSYYFLNESNQQMNQNLRAALSTIVRDLRMAGNGIYVLNPTIKLVQAYVPSKQRILSNGRPGIDPTDGWFAHADAITSDRTTGVRPIFGMDGLGEHSDTVTTFRTDIEFSTSLGQVVNLTSTKITLKEPINKERARAGELLALTNNGHAMLFEVDETATSDTAEIKIKSDGRFTNPAGPPYDSFLYRDSLFSLPFVDAELYNVRDAYIVTYYVDEETNRLMAAFHDQARRAYDLPASKSVVVADNIEDLQLYYFFDNDDVNNELVSSNPIINSKLLDTNAVKAVTIGLTAIASYGDARRTKFRPALFNRLAGATRDDRRRETIQQTIFLRNQQ
jgi:hypothetical protein